MKPVSTDPDVRFSRIRFLGCTRFRARHLRYENTRCRFVATGSLGFTSPRRSMALLKAFQVKLLRFPPRRFSHLKAHSTAQL